MSCKHVDIVAIAILLAGMALFATTRHAASIVIPRERVIAAPFHPLIVTPKPPYVAFTLD